MMLVTEKKLYGLDHLRALAIVLVFVFHYGRIFPHPEWTNTISKFGWTGVDLFFVLSGYLIASQLFLKISEGKSISFRDFFVKRFFRIIPAYLVVVAIYFLFPYVHEREALAPLWKYLTFTQNLGLDLRTQGTFSHAWSLCIEEQFYLLLPLTLIALIQFRLLKKAGWLLLFLFILGFAARYFSYVHFVQPNLDSSDIWYFWYKWIYYPTYCRLDGLLAGVGLAAVLQFRPAWKEKLSLYANWFLLAGILVLTVAYFLCMEEESFGASVFGFPLVSLGYGLLVLSAVCPKGLLYKKGSLVTAQLATLSYAIYLSHKFVIHVTQDIVSRVGVAADSNSMFIICITTSLSVALLMNRLVEKPFLALRDVILKRWQQAG